MVISYVCSEGGIHVGVLPSRLPIKIVCLCPLRHSLTSINFLFFSFLLLLFFPMFSIVNLSPVALPRIGDPTFAPATIAPVTKSLVGKA